MNGLTEDQAERELGLLYNYERDDSRQFTRWQMQTAIAHGFRLAASNPVREQQSEGPPVLPDDCSGELSTTPVLQMIRERDAALAPAPQTVAGDELLGEALFVLSDKLRAAGFLEDDANHAAYEAVVKAFTTLSPQPAPEDSAARARELLANVVEQFGDKISARDVRGNVPYTWISLEQALRAIEAALRGDGGE